MTQEVLPPDPDAVRESFTITDEIAWKNSTQVLDLIRTIVQEGATRTIHLETNEIISSLQKLLQMLEFPTLEDKGPPVSIASSNVDIAMPPQASVVTILRWARGAKADAAAIIHSTNLELENVSNTRLTWLAQILPLNEFAQICQKVYFSVDGYTEIDYILANGYLSYVFFEHLVVSGQSGFAEYSQLCRRNLDTSIAKLPVLTSSSMNGTYTPGAPAFFWLQGTWFLFATKDKT